VPGCFNEVATALSDAVRRKVVYVQCDPQEMRQHLIEAGISENAADQMLEMYDAIESGRMKSLLPRTAGITTTTTLAEFVHDTLVPQMAVNTMG
jgi:SOS response regulatory protein OraA/RecX